MNHTATYAHSAPAASRVLTDLALIINQGPSVEDVLSLVVERAVSALGGAAGSVMMPGDEGGPMRVAAALGHTPNAGADGHPEGRVAAWVVENDAPALLLGRTGPLAHLLHREDIRDAVCVPLRFGGRAIGALSVSNSTNREPFQQADVDLLTSIGHLAAVAIENTRLYDEARDHRARLKAVLHRLWTAQEAERKRLAADLHDGAAQSLYHIRVLLQTARREQEEQAGAGNPWLERVDAATCDALAQVRAVMTGLRPPGLDALGLAHTLRAECEAVCARGRVAVEVRIVGEPRRLEDSAETGLYYIAREALLNVERHSGAERAMMDISFTPRDVTIRVEDAGRGFDGETARDAVRAGHLGLETLRERAQDLGAMLEIRSQPGRGTCVTVRYRDRAVQTTL